MKFKKINMHTWKRKDIFTHFIGDVKCVMCLNVTVDVTDLVTACKQKGYRFYPVFIYLISKIVNCHEEFKMGYDAQGNVGFWERVDPSYVVFHPEDELFTRLITEFSSDFITFYERVLKDMEEHKNKRGHEIPYPNRNTFDVSCLPWVHYNAFDMHIFDSGTYLAPVITWGKYENHGGKITMPLTMQLHHAAADGFHLGRFFSQVEKESVQLSVYLSNIEKS